VDAGAADLEVDNAGISMVSDVVAMMVSIFGRVDGKEQTTGDFGECSSQVLEAE
jgi:hypothetical protein